VGVSCWNEPPCTVDERIHPEALPDCMVQRGAQHTYYPLLVIY
jgi:hypothetical protein